MERPDLLERAQQGDPRAIAAILNQQLKYQAIECRATVTDRLLHLVLRAEDETPDRNRALDFVRAKLVNLDINGLARVRLYGLAPDTEPPSEEPQATIPDAPAWTHEFALAVGGYSHLIAAKANATGDRPAPPADPPPSPKPEPTALSLAIVAAALATIVVSGYWAISRNSQSSPADRPTEPIPSEPDTAPPSAPPVE